MVDNRQQRGGLPKKKNEKRPRVARENPDKKIKC